MKWDVFSKSKSIKDSGVDIVGVAAVDVFVTLDDSFCLFSDTTLESIFDMAKVYVAVVEWLDSSGFPSLFFGILNFLTLFRFLDVPFPAFALQGKAHRGKVVLPSRKKQQKVNDFYFMKEVAFKE